MQLRMSIARYLPSHIPDGRWMSIETFKKIYSNAIDFDSLVKSRKTTCLQECLVFGVLCLVAYNLDITRKVSYQTRSNRQMMNSSFYEFIIFDLPELIPA